MDEERSLTDEQKQEKRDKYCSYNSLSRYKSVEHYHLTSWILGLLALTGWIVAVVFAVMWDKSQHGPPEPLPTLSVSDSWMGEFPNGAVAADNGVCSEVGRNILSNGGNVVDAAIAALVCDGNQNPFSMGIGGGFFMVIYNVTTKKCTAIDARETAPLNLAETEQKHGWGSIAVPGEVMGYWEAHQRFGSLPWKQVLTPGIKLAKDGTYVSKAMSKVLNYPFVNEKLLNEPTMGFYVDSNTGNVFKEGKLLKNPILAQTLEKLANSDNPVELFYRKSLGQDIVKEIQKFGGNLTLDDLKSYKVRIYEGWKTNLTKSNMTFCSLDLPSGGPATGLYMQLLEALNITSKDMTTTIERAGQTYHKMLEAMKHTYGHWKYFGDSMTEKQLEVIKKMKRPQYSQKIAVKIDKIVHSLDYYDSKLGVQGKTGPLDKGGTAQISVLDKFGNAVSVTSSINWLFGSMRRSPTTGIVWNNHLADFATDKDGANSMKPGKRPRSAMAPSIFIDRSDNKAKLVIGGAGGSKILGSVGYVSGRILYLNETCKYASDAPRFYNRLESLESQMEESFPHEYVHQLEKMGHRFSKQPMPSIIQTAEYVKSSLRANTDYRKPSYPSGF